MTRDGGVYSCRSHWLPSPRTVLEAAAAQSRVETQRPLRITGESGADKRISIRESA